MIGCVLKELIEVDHPHVYTGMDDVHDASGVDDVEAYVNDVGDADDVDDDGGVDDVLDGYQ